MLITVLRSRTRMPLPLEISRIEPGCTMTVTPVLPGAANTGSVEGFGALVSQVVVCPVEGVTLSQAAMAEGLRSRQVRPSERESARASGVGGVGEQIRRIFVLLSRAANNRWSSRIRQPATPVFSGRGTVA
jgi:hypothetical protein